MSETALFSACKLAFCETSSFVLKYADILWNRSLVLLEDKLSSTTVDFIRSEGKLKTKCLY